MKRIVIALMLAALAAAPALAGEGKGMKGHMMEGGMMKHEMMGGGMMGAGKSGDSSSPSGPATQEKKAGDVTVVATFNNPASVGKGERLTFAVKLDTHSVDLDAFSFEKDVALRDDKGNTWEPVSVKPTGSGHHREAEVGFEDPGAVSSVDLIVRNVAGVGETVFQWKVKEEMMEK